MISHLTSLQGQAEHVLQLCPQEQLLSRAALHLLWARLFQRIAAASADELDALITLSQKLSSTTGNLRSLELKEAEFIRKEAGEGAAPEIPDFSQQVLLEIERKLNLL